MSRGFPAVVLGLCLALAVPPAQAAEGARERTAQARRAKAKAKARKARPAARAAPSLEKARAQLAAVKRDPQKRRFRHHWERAIRALTAAARGKDAGPALLDAGRARYALYRFSQVESDRDEALRLAARARAAGSREAAAFAAAVRREAGDDEPRPAPRKMVARAARPPARGPAAAPAPPRPSEPAEEERDEEDLDEALGKALAAGEEDAARPSPRPFEARPEGASGEEPARVSEIRSWSNADSTRVVVSLSRPATFTRQELPADGTHPRRLAIDIPGALLEGAAAAHPVGGGQVERVRTGQNGPDTVRVVLDLRGDQEVQVAALQDPPQLLIDVGAARAPALARPPERPAPAGAAAAEFTVSRPIRRIIVDAGHGGHDSGAIGPTRVREKDVTLAMARRLKQKLEGQGYEVLLTRADDRYLRLDERTWFANDRQGDLFISIHANAHPRRDRRGTETFVLNVADDRYARRLAARENGALSDDAGEGPEVKHILADLDAQSSAEPSRRLARLVQRELVSGIRTRSGEARDLGVKSALFYVLLGARMPAVLVETAFISNRAEERRLKDPRFQEAVATSLARAVGAFARGEARVAAR